MPRRTAVDDSPAAGQLDPGDHLVGGWTPG